MSDPTVRKLRGAWYTPGELVDTVVAAALDTDADTAAADSRAAGRGRVVRVVDPACGDGRFLLAAALRVLELGGIPEVVGVDIDAGACAAARAALAGIDAVIIEADALRLDWSPLAPFDLVIGNPPFLSQMATSTTRGGSSRRGGGPYADAAVEFLALAAEIVDAEIGRVAFVVPQSVLSARDAGQIRDRYDRSASMIWSWWTGERVFDANVLTCALLFQFGRPAVAGAQWADVVTTRSGVPAVPSRISTDGVLGDRCRLNANFRDEYYGLVPAVGDHAAGPKLITSGLIDPGHCWWGRRPITFAKRRFEQPRIDLSALSGKMPKWAADRLVPKVLIANQTRIIEAVADPLGDLLPGVPVVAAYPTLGQTGDGVAGDEISDPARSVWEIAAVLTSPLASTWAWHRSAGTGLSADSIRIGPVVLADLPWPGGSLDVAVELLRAGDVRGCAEHVHRAYDIAHDDELVAWWHGGLRRIEERQPADVTVLAPGTLDAELRH